ncbi:DUF5343 domain-containing protein [Stutzerimonas stutzeri]|uniref:DUF5343 domain-containing protein n=1 Tax=Stutzerimonas stutzeri TaxID=316 RepID=UPI0012FDFE94|nr:MULTISPECIES: DUF5343 domain-containing protein [Gammaproteobacteria]
MTSQKRLKTCLEKIKEASTPELFNEKFLNEKLNMQGGSARTLPPYLKRINFVSSDGTPTDWYREFRNPSLAGSAAFKALKHAYADLFDVNENIHKKGDAELKGVVAQVTGLDHDSPVITSIVATFKTLKSFATLDHPTTPIVTIDEIERTEEKSPNSFPTERQNSNIGLNIGYNINLNLPATSDIAVFDAIFKSLKEHLLKE